MLILDFDGVLVDSEPIHFESWNQAFNDLFGVRVEGDYRQLVGLTQQEIYDLWAKSNPVRVIELSKEDRARVLARKTELFFSIGMNRLTPMPGSIDLLRKAHAKGWYTAIASRAKRLRLHRTLHLIHMPALFDVVLGLEDAVDPRTNRKIHARAAEMFGIDPARCVVVEDSESGVAAAIDCGIGRVIGFAHAIDRAALEAAGAHEIVSHLSEIQLPDG
jgi:HAD superfamily hydrolase (TIGR01509 family)